MVTWPPKHHRIISKPSKLETLFSKRLMYCCNITCIACGKLLLRTFLDSTCVAHFWNSRRISRILLNSARLDAQLCERPFRDFIEFVNQVSNLWNGGNRLHSACYSRNFSVRARLSMGGRINNMYHSLSQQCSPWLKKQLRGFCCLRRGRSIFDLDVSLHVK